MWAISLTAFLILATPPTVYIMKLLYDRFGAVWRQVLPFFITSIIFGIITIYFQNFRAINREYVPGYIVNPIESGFPRPASRWASIYTRFLCRRS